MAETNDVQALEKISTEVVDSQVKIILSSQCIKAQAFLFDKLRKQSNRQKEICKFISSSNLKLESEIQLAEQEIKSHNIALETIKFGNIELKKEYLLSKERKGDIFQRTKNGIKKYESVWATSKKRYESIPCIQKLIEAKNKTNVVKANISALLNESEQLISQIKIKKNDLSAKDRARIIELAEFFVHKRPKMLQAIDELSNKIRQVSDEVESLLKEEQECKNNSKLFNQTGPKHDNLQATKAIEDPTEDNWCNLSKNIDKDAIALPTLHLQNNDLDILSVKLDQIKKVDLQNTASGKRMEAITSFDLEQNSLNRCKNVENFEECYISSYFDISTKVHFGNDDDKKVISKQYADKKIINILEDIKLDKNDTYEIIKKLEPSKFQETCIITSKDKSDKYNHSQDKTNKSMEIEEIEEIDLTTKKPEEDTVAPPTPFLDITQITQEKKTVSFNVPNEEKVSTSMEEDLIRQDEIDIYESQDKTLNTSKISEDSFTTIKDKMLKKHNLDLSPQFVYSKNTLKQMPCNDKIITSKFFENNDKFDFVTNSDKDVNNKNIIQEEKNVVECKENNIQQREYIDETELQKMEVVDIVASSPKQEANNSEVPVTGLLFNYGSQGIPDSLNISMNTTGFEDEDFPHCIDSSILLSPKADIPTSAISSNNEVVSQDVPNFLAGFRKTGLSFFGSTMTSDPKPGTSAQNQSSGFNFTFGNEEKKGRSGFFSMFR